MEEENISIFTLPKKYIQYSGKECNNTNLVSCSLPGEYPITEYEIDDGDEKFLANLNRNSKVVITEDLFERLFDFLEKKSYDTVCSQCFVLTTFLQMQKEYSKIVPVGEKNKNACCVCLVNDRRMPSGFIPNSSMSQCIGCKIYSHACMNYWLLLFPRLTISLPRTKYPRKQLDMPALLVCEIKSTRREKETH